MDSGGRNRLPARRAGEPAARVVFFVNDQQVEVEDVPRLSQGQLRHGFVRNRPPIALV